MVGVGSGMIYSTEAGANSDITTIPNSAQRLFPNTAPAQVTRDPSVPGWAPNLSAQEYYENVSSPCTAKQGWTCGEVAQKAYYLKNRTSINPFAASDAPANEAPGPKLLEPKQVGGPQGPYVPFISGGNVDNSQSPWYRFTGDVEPVAGSAQAVANASGQGIVTAGSAFDGTTIVKTERGWTTVEAGKTALNPSDFSSRSEFMTACQANSQSEFGCNQQANFQWGYSVLPAETPSNAVVAKVGAPYSSEASQQLVGSSNAPAPAPAPATAQPPCVRFAYNGDCLDEPLPPVHYVDIPLIGPILNWITGARSPSSGQDNSAVAFDDEARQSASAPGSGPVRWANYNDVADSGSPTSDIGGFYRVNSQGVPADDNETVGIRSVVFQQDAGGEGLYGTGWQQALNQNWNNWSNWDYQYPQVREYGAPNYGDTYTNYNGNSGVFQTAGYVPTEYAPEQYSI